MPVPFLTTSRVPPTTFLLTVLPSMFRRQNRLVSSSKKKKNGPMVPVAYAGEEGNSSDRDSILRRAQRIIRRIVARAKWRFDSHTQEDVAQNALLALDRELRKGTKPEDLDRFVHVLAIRACIDEIRRQVRRKKWEIPWISDPYDEKEPWVTHSSSHLTDPWRRVAQIERIQVLKRLVSSLDETCRQIINLRYRDGLRYEEIARKLSISVNTVGTRLHRCLQRLRAAAEKNGLTAEDF